MSQMQLPKWGDLTPYERHKLLGEIIDAMIYSGEAVYHLQVTVEQFRAMGWVRSVIMPDVHQEDKLIQKQNLINIMQADEKDGLYDENK